MVSPHEFYALYSDQSVSAIHHALRSSRRRLTVILVASQKTATVRDVSKDHESYQEKPYDDESITVREISRQIVSVEEGIPEEQATGDSYHNVYTSLTQTHLPRLEAIQAIKYDSDRKTVRPSQNLLALATVSTASTPLIYLLFHSSSSDTYSGGSVSLEY